MKIVIDIPDEIYDDIKHGYICSEYADTLIQLIPSSKPYEERLQGEWIYHTNGYTEFYTCNKCNKICNDPDEFCKHCGAEMTNIK